MLNIVIGAGLLALPGLAVEAAGSQAIWSWILCSIIALPLIIAFIIMGRKYPDAGGTAHFTKMAFGDAGYIICSLIFLGAVVFGLPAIALTGGYYLAEIIHVPPPVIAFAFIVSAAFSLQFSPEIGSRLSTVIAAMILLTLLVLLTTGFSTIEWGNVPGRITPIIDIDIDLLLAPLLMIFFAFTGWEVASGLSEEFKRPERDFAYAMILSFVIAVFLYIAIAFIVQTVEIQNNYEAAFVVIIEDALGASGRIFITILVALIIFANLLAAIWAISRLVYSLSRENVLPLKLKLNSQGTPVSSISITAGVLLLVLGADAINLLNIRDMLTIAGLNFLIIYGLTGVSLFKLTESRLEKIVASLTVLISFVLCLLVGSTVIYPIGLALAGMVIHRMKSLHSKG